MVYVFLARGLEEIEAVTPIDLLRRAGIPVTTVGVGGREIEAAHGIRFVADIAESELRLGGETQAIVLPGGMPGTANLGNSATVREAVLSAEKNGWLIAAICAAPTLLARWGLLAERKATVYPDPEYITLLGESYCNRPVVCENGLITARAAGSAVDFSLAIIEQLKGKQAAEKIAAAIYFEA